MVFRWRALKGAIDRYHQSLSGALEIHGFNRDVDDTRSRIGEKSVILATEDTGRDLAQVESLQRKQERVLRDMSAIQKKIEEHRKTAKILSNKYTPQKEPIRETLLQAEDEWQKLCAASETRQKSLSASYTLHKFQADLKELKKWEDDVVNRMNSSPLPVNTPQAEMFLQEHQERKVVTKCVEFYYIYWSV